MYHRRLKAVCSDEDRIAWLELSDAYMTEESESEEGVVTRHELTWTSDSTYVYNQPPLIITFKARYICTHTHTHTHAHTHTHIHTHINTHTHIHAHTHTRTHIHTHAHTHIHTHTHAHTHAHTHTHTHINTHTHIHAHTHAHTYTHAHTHIHTHIHTHTHTHAHTHTHTHTHIHTTEGKLLTLYIGLKEFKAVLDQRIRESNRISGRFSSKPRRDGALSTLPPPSNPIEWAIMSPTDEALVETDEWLGGCDTGFYFNVSVLLLHSNHNAEGHNLMVDEFVETGFSETLNSILESSG